MYAEISEKAKELGVAFGAIDCEHNKDLCEIKVFRLFFLFFAFCRPSKQKKKKRGKRQFYLRRNADSLLPLTFFLSILFSFLFLSCSLS
jgi:hypothetical protein